MLRSWISLRAARFARRPPRAPRLGQFRPESSPDPVPTLPSRPRRQPLQHQHRRALAHHKPVARAVERPGRLFRTVVKAGREGAGGGEGAQADAVDARFRAAGQRHIRLTGADDADRIADRLQAGGAGRGRRPERPAQAMADRDLAGCQVGETAQKECLGNQYRGPDFDVHQSITIDD